MSNDMTIEVKTEGLEEATEQIEDLSDALNCFPPQVQIRNCRDCVFNIYPSQIREVKDE